MRQNDEYKIVCTYPSFEVRLNVFSEQQGLFATRSFEEGDRLIEFSTRSVRSTPTYLTVQIEEDKHFEFEPDYLKFMNHGCDPNVFIDLEKHALVASRTIGVGDELRFFYPSTEWKMDRPFDCGCGSANCIGVVSGAHTLSRSELSGYRLSPYIQQKLDRQKIQTLQAVHVWVLAPHLESADPNLSCYYDFTQSIEEYKKVFAELRLEWTWQPVTLQNFREILGQIALSNKPALILNLCDGDEINGAPGISVIQEMDRLGLTYTGSDEHFYRITTSKIPMKKAFDKFGVSTANWRVITEKKGTLKGLGKRVGLPMIIKPAVSGGSMGVSVKNVVHTEEELIARVEEVRHGYRGWNLLADGLFVEQFISGPEFTTFITGSADDPDHCVVYEPVQRVFHESLPETEKFLSFDRLWEIYEEETPMPEQGNFYEYTDAPAELIPAIKELSLQGYRACGGKGYTRIDIRQDAQTGKLYMLEANAQCGLSEDENYTSIGAILKASKVSFTQVIEAILYDAIRRSSKRPSKKKSIKLVDPKPTQLVK